MYSISGYADMIADSVRMDAYYRAIQTAVKPGSVVLDIGAGTGILSLLACQFGARKVYAVEPSPALAVAKMLAKANGYADRIEFFQGLSSELEIPEKVDVIVSDLRGCLPLYQHHIPALVDARTRLLSQEGILIPQRDTMKLAPIHNSELYLGYQEAFGKTNFGLDLSPMNPFIFNTWQKVRLKPEHLLLEPKTWATLDYRSITETNARATLSWTVNDPGEAHGVALWFDAALFGDSGFSNNPHAEKAIYGQAFFPFLQPLHLQTSDVLAIDLRADLIAQDYVWTWMTRLSRQGQADLQFRQSTFLSEPQSPQALQKKARDYQPKLNAVAELDLFILSEMKKNLSLGDIAKHFQQHFPSFHNDKEALTYVAELSVKYSE